MVATAMVGAAMEDIAMVGILYSPALSGLVDVPKVKATTRDSNALSSKRSSGNTMLGRKNPNGNCLPVTRALSKRPKRNGKRRNPNPNMMAN